MRVHLVPLIGSEAEDRTPTLADVAAPPQGEVAWVGPKGLPNDIWERILQNADLDAWWRAAGACRELRAHGLAVMRAQLSRHGVGRLAPEGLSGPDQVQSMDAALRRRTAVTQNLAARSLKVDILWPGAWSPTWALPLADDKMLRGDAGCRVEQICVRPPGSPRRQLSALPSLQRSGADIFSRLTTLGGHHFYAATPRQLTWWRAGRLEISAGMLRAPRHNDIVAATLANDGRLAGAIFEGGEVRVVDTAAVPRRAGEGSWQWRPDDARPGRTPVPLSLALPDGGQTVLILQVGGGSGPELSCWQLTGAAPRLRWGPLALDVAAATRTAAPAPLLQEPGSGHLFLAPDDRHVVAVACTHRDGVPATTSAPVLLSLDDDLAPCGPPRDLRAAQVGGEADETHVVWSLSGRELLVGVQADAGDFVRRWQISEMPGVAPRATHRFAGGDGSADHLAISGGGRISHLAIAGDGVRVAVGRPGGRLEMWRADGPIAELAWTFKPGRADYLSVDFVDDDRRLVLSMEGGGVVSLDMGAQRPLAPTDPATVRVGEGLRGLEEIHLGAVDVARLRPS